MKILKTATILIFIIMCFTYSLVEGGTFNSFSDCLVTSDIGIYSFDSESANIGKGSGVVSMAGHFNKDHDDTVCTGEYSNINEIRGLPVEEARKKIIGIEVEVTKHAGSDSDKWLLHEVEKSFRTYYGLPDESLVVRQINGNTVIAMAVAGWAYRWASGNKVIQISYHDSQMEKPEPLEVVSAYLAKHPSTLTPMTSAELRSDANKTKWIKDEMERRLWLCDKWFFQLQLQKAELNKVLQESVDHMKVFLDYREKYYGISAEEEKKLLWGYLRTNNGTGIKNKLAEYKNWWKKNKDKAISV